MKALELVDGGLPGANDTAKKLRQQEEIVWDKRISKKVRELIEDKIQIFRRDLKYDGTESARPFVNSINVKLKAKEIPSIKKRRKDEFLE